MSISSNKTVFFDMDGVLVNFIDGFCEYFSEYTNSENQVNIRNWKFYKDLGLTDDEFQGWVETLPVAFWAELAPLEGFEQFSSDIRELQIKGYEVEILTHAVSEAARVGKKKWLEINGLGDLTYHPVRKAKDKAGYANENSILVDDNENNILQFIDNGGEGLLVEQPWNGGYHAAEVMNCWLTSGGGIVGWVSIALGHANLEEPVIDVKAVIDLINEDSYGYPVSDDDSCFEIPTIEVGMSDIPDGLYNAYDTPPPAGVLPQEQPKLDYAAMDDKEYRKKTPLCSGVLWYFPDALELVAQNSMVGWHQHCDTSKPMYWDRSKSADEPDAMVRHLKDHHKNPIDDDGTLHLSKVAWRALAMLQKYLEENPNWRQRNVK